MRIVRINLVVLILAGVITAFIGYNYIFSSNTNRDIDHFYINPGSSYEDVRSQLEEQKILENYRSFDLVSGLMKYKKEVVPSGKYSFKAGTNNRELISKLRSGNQDAVKVTFNNIRKIENLAGALAPYFYIDSLDLMNIISSTSFREDNNVNADNAMSLFIPNTYQMYWDDSAEKIINRLISERNKFWKQNNRKQKAKSIGLTLEEVYTLAAIVEKESNHKQERPRIAGLYMNRIKRGIPLQADPTVVFATGLFDLKRVLNIHLEFDSPYNTYRNQGLPPGPITMPSINSIDAVLNYEKHEYIYMCSKPGYGTQHAFAETHRQHEINANKYRRWLNSEGIR